jgi:hypothetical protein
MMIVQSDIFINNYQMIIGSNFSKKCDQVLLEAAKQSGNKVGVKISVKSLNQVFKFERTEIKNILEFMQNRDLVELETIGGPLLYGHISLTSYGLKRIEKIKNN